MAKFVLALLWNLGLGLVIFVVGVAVASAVHIRGWSLRLEVASFGSLMLIALLTYMLMPFVALLASVGRGYLPPLGWAFLTLALAQIAAVLGWGDWFPWSVPALLSGAAGPQAAQLGMHSFVMVAAAFTVGSAATFAWWLRADQAR